MKTLQFATHHFSDIADFPCEDYSKLKFGSDSVAKSFAKEMAIALMTTHSALLLSNQVVVIPSPYNHVENAATIITRHFVNALNNLLVRQNGNHVEYSVIHRKVSYINDYGFLSKEARKGLIDNDSFYLNKDFYVGKLLIFLDDVFITGTHEDKVKEILAKEELTNDRLFVYYGQYHGDNPKVESQINFCGMQGVTDLYKLSQEPNHHFIVRPLKYILGQSKEDCKWLIGCLSCEQIEKIYYGCLGEGYYKIPSYQANFGILQDKFNSLLTNS